MAKRLSYVRKFFRKINISYALIPTRTSAYQELRNGVFSEKNFEKRKFENNFGPSLSLPQSAITCLKLTIETLEQGVKYLQSQQ